MVLECDAYAKRDDGRSLIADMAVALSEFEERAWDGDPRRRDADPLCKQARTMIDKANAIAIEKVEVGLRDTKHEPEVILTPRMIRSASRESEEVES
jgi:hypothetical protein